MKRKELCRSMALALAAFSMVSGVPVTALAAENQTVTQDASSEVIISGADSTFSVTVPKSIVGSGKSGTLSYDVTIQGDIAGDKTVKVVPDSVVVLKQARKADVEAAIVQDKTSWAADEFATKGNGTITYDGLSSGKWDGAFNFNIELASEGLVAGFYDADGKLLKSWADAGLGTEVTEAVLRNLNLNGTLYKVVLPDGVTEISGGVFSPDVDGLLVTELVMSNTVTYIGASAFNDNNLLQNVIFSDSLIEISTYAFRATRLENVVLSSAETIGDNAFWQCNNLKSVTLPDNLKTIGRYVFQRCPNLTTITYKGVTYTQDATGLFAAFKANNVTYDYEMFGRPGEATENGGSAWYK